VDDEEWAELAVDSAGEGALAVERVGDGTSEVELMSEREGLGREVAEKEGEGAFALRSLMDEVAWARRALTAGSTGRLVLASPVGTVRVVRREPEPDPDPDPDPEWLEPGELAKPAGVLERPPWLTVAARTEEEEDEKTADAVERGAEEEATDEGV
jgi:hypothetical protein